MALPKLEWNKKGYENMSNVSLVPEFTCSDFSRSLDFYTNILGFGIRYSRTEECFAYLEKEGAELMIEQATNSERMFVVGDLVYPYGRGMNLQIMIANVNELYSKVQSANCSIFLPIEDKWYRSDNVELGQRQFIVMDPDGYLLRFAQRLGTRSIK